MNKGKQNDDKKNKKYFISFYKTFKSFGEVFPILFGVILLLGFFRTSVSKKMMFSVFTRKWLQDTIIGSVIDSISADNPVTIGILFL